MKFPPLNSVESLPPVPSCEEDLEEGSFKEEQFEEVLDEILSSNHLQEILENDEMAEENEKDSDRSYNKEGVCIRMKGITRKDVDDLKIELEGNRKIKVKLENLHKDGDKIEEKDSEDELKGGDYVGDNDDEGVKMRKKKNECDVKNVDEITEEKDNGDTANNDQLRFNFLSRAEELAKKIWAAGWMVVHHKHLPRWLKDNDFLIKGHRAPMHSYWRCFKSIFRVHTETGNIWTHLLGCIAFIAVTIYFNIQPSEVVHLQEKIVFSAFFFGAISCLTLSTTFHTVYCHSEKVGMLFNRLDYCGISMLTMGSFVPWLYYCFYCHPLTWMMYTTLIFVLGMACIVVSMFQKFASATFRPVRAGVFIGLGLSALIPAMHYILLFGFWHAVHYAALNWLVLMAVLYIVGAVIYAMRVPERIWPGRFDIWCQSHQIFHVFVVIAAFIHYHGITIVATERLAKGDCTVD